MSKLDILRIATATPSLRICDVEYNKNEILNAIRTADLQGASFVVLPELALTGYTAGDILFQPLLYDKQIEALSDITNSTKDLKIVAIVGFYVRISNHFYNCAAIIKGGKIRGIVPKHFLPNSGEFGEMRWFDSATNVLSTMSEINLSGEYIPFGNLIFCDETNDIAIGVEICKDIWTPISPSSFMAMAGAHIIFNLSASNDIAGKAKRRKANILSHSRKNLCAYAYTSSGVGESTGDILFTGHQLIAECGSLISESERFQFDTYITYGDIDIGRIKYERAHLQNLNDCMNAYLPDYEYTKVALGELRTIADIIHGEKNCVQAIKTLKRTYSKNPFLPIDSGESFDYLDDVFRIQSTALARRMSHIGHKKTILGISGGLDSTLALLICAEALRLLDLPISNIIAVTMPGFGTTDHTHENALSMMKLLGVDMREISIKPAVLQHFADIGHDKDIHDLTYENSQARERTQILMDLASRENALMIGTGDLSELALGWCTFNGDHMSMYGVNAGVPKTLIPHVLKHILAVRYSGKSDLASTIQSVIDTPISPELLPPTEAGDIAQKTEDKVGPYVLHDFFIYHTLINGMTPAKLYFVAKQVFAGEYDALTIKKWLKTFYMRFFSQQFKRNCSVDCPKVLDLSLSPRGDLHMPSDAYSTLWQAEVDNLE